MKHQLKSYLELEQLGTFLGRPPANVIEARVPPMARLLIGLFSMNEPIGSLQRFETNRYFLDALGVDNFPESSAFAKWLTDHAADVSSYIRTLPTPFPRPRPKAVANIDRFMIRGGRHTWSVLVANLGGHDGILHADITPTVDVDFLLQFIDEALAAAEHAGASGTRFHVSGGLARVLTPAHRSARRTRRGAMRPPQGLRDAISRIGKDDVLGLGTYSVSAVRALLHAYAYAFSYAAHLSQSARAARSPRPLAARDIAFLRKNGYLIIRNVLSTREVRTAAKIVRQLATWERERNCSYEYGHAGKLQRVFNLINKHSFFRDLVQMPIVLSVLDELFDRDTLHHKYHLCSFHANIIGPEGQAQVLHADANVPNPLPPWIIRANINFLLDDFTETNGATLVLPGSHQYLRKPGPDDQKRRDLVKIIAPRGSIVIWHGHLWHRSGANETRKPRTALLAAWSASWLREMSAEENYSRTVDERVLAGSSVLLRNLLGTDHGIKKGAMQAPPPFDPPN